jgi:hypothetical protein
MATMTPRFYTSAARQETIGWMLILAFLSLTLFPRHYHIHHVADPVVHDSSIQEHVIDIHSHADINDISHHINIHIIKSSVDSSLKTPGFQPSWVAIPVIFSLLLPLLAHKGHRYPLSAMQRLPRFIRHRIPPLRAPPRT